MESLVVVGVAFRIPVLRQLVADVRVDRSNAGHFHHILPFSVDAYIPNAASLSNMASPDDEVGLFNNRQRRYLLGESDIEPKSNTERMMRGRIRDRVRQAVRDFTILDKNLERRDWEQIFDLGDREHSTPSDVASGDVDLADHEVRVGLVRIIAWVYRVSKYCPSVPPFEDLVKSGVAFGESPPHVRAPTQRAEVTVEVESGEPIKLGEALEKLDASGPAALDEDELRAFTHFANRHPDVPLEDYQDLYEQEFEEAVEKKRIEEAGEDFGYVGHLVDPEGEDT